MLSYFQLILDKDLLSVSLLFVFEIFCEELQNEVNQKQQIYQVVNDLYAYIIWNTKCGEICIFEDAVSTEDKRYQVKIIFPNAVEFDQEGVAGGLFKFIIGEVHTVIIYLLHGLLELLF